jgi:hypothetical protein
MEYWDLSARLESGHFVFARLLITNIGPGTRTAAGIGTLILPDGKVVPFRYGRLKGSWTISDTRDVIDIASLTLDLGRQPRHFEMDSDRHGIKIHLDFATPGPPVWSPDTAASPQLDVLEMGAPITGSIWVKGMTEPVQTRGSVTLTHAWMDESEARLVLRQVEILVQRPDLTLYAADFTQPGGARRQWLAVRRGKDVIYRSDALASDIQNSQEAGTSYPLPAELQLKNDEVTLRATTKREIFRLDPTEVVPQPFRFLLTMEMKPQRITADADCQVELPHLAGGPVSFAEKCFVVATYLNALAPRGH